jgi:hypothetical protein
VILSVIFYTLNSAIFTTVLRHFLIATVLRHFVILLYWTQPFCDFAIITSVILWSCQQFFIHWTQHFLLQCSTIFSYCYSARPFCDFYYSYSSFCDLVSELSHLLLQCSTFFVDTVLRHFFNCYNPQLFFYHSRDLASHFSIVFNYFLK